MKLLIFTQKLDKTDPTLGFFHNWIVGLSKDFDKVTVICLEKGKVDLPESIKFFSLGKESGRSRFKYLKNFYNLILGLHKDYDAVFVHMNQEYVILGGLIWHLIGKKIFMWRNHKVGNILTRISVLLSNRVFCTSNSAFVARFKKTLLMPIGIDVSLFEKQPSSSIIERDSKILFLSRMDEIKRPHLLIEALRILNKEKVNFVCNFYGDPSQGSEDYYTNLKIETASYGLSSQVNFHSSVKHTTTPSLYNSHKIFVNLTQSGSLDKTILESVLGGCIPVVSNSFFEGIFEPEMIVSEDPKDIANKIKFWLGIKESELKKFQKKLIQYTIMNHSLDILLKKLCIEIKK